MIKYDSYINQLGFFIIQKNFLLFLHYYSSQKIITFNSTWIPSEFFVMKSCLNVWMTVLIPCSENWMEIIRYPLFSVIQQAKSVLKFNFSSLSSVFALKWKFMHLQVKFIEVRLKGIL